jgi:hypothetical protein
MERIIDCILKGLGQIEIRGITAEINSVCVSEKTPGLRRRSLKKWLKIQLVNKTGRWVCDL